MEQREKPSKEQMEQWHADPHNWKLGMFYYNPADKRILPPKRFKWAGYTVNFANPRSILAILVLIAAIVCIVVLLSRL